MNKNLLQKLSSILVAGSMIATLAGCNLVDETKLEALRELKTTVIEDSQTSFKYIYSVKLISNESGYYIQFEGHNDKGTSSTKYLQHKHQIVTYSLSEDDYNNYHNLFGGKFILKDNKKLDSELLNQLNQFVLENDPISTEEKTDNFIDGV